MTYKFTKHDLDLMSADRSYDRQREDEQLGYWKSPGEQILDRFCDVAKWGYDPDDPNYFGTSRSRRGE